VPNDTKPIPGERQAIPHTAAVNSRGHLRAVGRWSSLRAWSRPAAVAQLISVGTPRRVLARTSRAALFTIGVLLIAFAVGVMLWNDLGPGPIDVFIGAVRVHTGLPLSVALWITVGSILSVAWLLGRRPGLGSVLSALAVGPVMQLVVEQLEPYDLPSMYVARLAIHVAAIGVVGFGAGALIASGLGAGSGELLAAAASHRTGHPEIRVRVAFEVTWVVLGILLGGPIGVGTVLVAFLIGPAVAHGHRLIDSFVTASRRQLDLAAA